MRKIIGVAVAVAALGSLVTGCGGDDGKKISKADFVTQANAICRATAAKGEAAAAALDPATLTPEGLANWFANEASPILRQQVVDLRNLGYPTGDKDTLEAIYRDTETAIGQLTANPQSLLDQSAPDPFEPINKRLGDYGLTDCAE